MTLKTAHFSASKPSSSVARMRWPVEDTGQEFGDSLDDAEDQRDQKDGHWRGVQAQLVAVKLIRRPANLPPLWKRPSHS